MECKYCNSLHVHKDGNHKGNQRYKCLDCGKRFDEGKYDGENGQIIHFNTRLKKSDRNRLTRENYCVPEKEICYKDRKIIQEAKDFYRIHGRYPLLVPRCYCEIPNSIFEDGEHHTDEYLEVHYKDCMRNFDLNMQFFDSLDFKTFDRYLLNFVKKNKFKEVSDLADVDGKTGAYIMVLDKYKQVYIGISRASGGIKSRILHHWSGKKEFSRLIYGSVETSILAIECFGALDTTRIFYKELKWYQNLDEFEAKVVAKFKPEYRLNRVAGGLNSEDDSTMRNMELLASMQKRNLPVDNTHREGEK